MIVKAIKKLSIIIPCFNEQATLQVIVDEIMDVDTGKTIKEIVIVDDCSSDDSLNIAKGLQKKYDNIKVIQQDKNRGKGEAVKMGILQSTGNLLIIQDADREYDPRDYNKMLDIFREDRADIVFGSRFSGGAPRRVVYLSNTIGNKFMSRLSAVLSGLYVSDIHTCYIMFDGDWIRNKAKRLTSHRFGFNPEIVAKIAKEKENLRICEVNVSYYGRSKKDGKKIRAKDAFTAILAIIYFNIRPGNKHEKEN